MRELEREVKLNKAGESEPFVSHDGRLKPPLARRKFGRLLQNQRAFRVGDIDDSAVGVGTHKHPDHTHNS